MATAASVDMLVLGRVIDDVVDMFVPAVSMSVHYGSKHITNGCDIKPSLASYPPKIHISGHPNELYTLVITDPDAPSPNEPTLREYLHRMVLDIPGGTNTARGNEIVSYVGPRPPLGIHRYIFVLYQQRGPLGLVEQPSCHSTFSTRSFACPWSWGFLWLRSTSMPKRNLPTESVSRYISYYENKKEVPVVLFGVLFLSPHRT